MRNVEISIDTDYVLEQLEPKNMVEWYGATELIEEMTSEQIVTGIIFSGLYTPRKVYELLKEELGEK